MKTTLQRLCDRFLAANAVVKSQFKLESIYIYPICANVYCARNAQPDEEQLAACKGLLKQRTGLFSSFRGHLTAPVAAMLAAGGNPEARMEQALENYAALKREFHGSEYLALAAFLLAELGVGARREEIAVRGRTLYRRMKQEHPLLTSAEDCVYAVLMALSPRSDDELIADMEACYRLLKRRFSASDAVQSASHVLCLAAGTPEEKTARLTALYDAIRAAGGKYGKRWELSALAALSILGGDLAELTADLMEVDGFLAGQKGYGLFGLDRKTRLLHAALLTADERCLSRDLTAADLTRSLADRSAETAARNAALTGTLAMIAAQQAAMCAMIAATSASTAASASH